MNRGSQREDILFQIKFWKKTLETARETMHPVLIRKCEKNIESLLETKAVIDF